MPFGVVHSCLLLRMHPLLFHHRPPPCPLHNHHICHLDSRPPNMLCTLPHPPMEAANQWTGRPALSVWRVRWRVVVVWVVLVVVVLVVAVVEGVHLAITVACLDT